MKTGYNNIFRLIGLIFLIGIFGLINSCKKSTPTEPQNSSPSPGTTINMGKISYSPDYSRKKSASLDTSAVDISTTDAEGIKWDLSIPKQAFPDSTDISIIPIKDVKSDSVLNIKNGVIFQPDGFQFSSTATLTVTIPNFSQKFVFYSFSQGGDNVEFTSFSGSGGVYKIPITHFSGAATGVPSNSDQCIVLK